MWRALALGLISTALSAGTLNQIALAPLPQAAAGNAVARVEIAGRVRMFSFFGINGEMQPGNLLRHAAEFDADFGNWHALPPVPGEGRVGASAIGVNGKVYLMGGYTLNKDGDAQALADVWRYEPLRQQFERLPALPTPVFDSAVIGFKQRYLLVMSGRNAAGGVNEVQILDIIAEKWLPPAPFVGTPLYGHSAGAIDNLIVLCGGAKPTAAVVRTECYSGLINEKNVQDIRWKVLPAIDGAGRLFAGATGTRINGQHVVFAGGSLAWHQLNGTDHDARPVSAHDEVVAYNVALQRWERWGRLPISGLNYRGLLELNGGLVTLGGIERNLRVTQAVRRFEPPLVQN